MSKANEVPRLTRAHQLAIREEARRLSEWHGRTISPQELLDRALGPDGLGSLWESYGDEDRQRLEKRTERRIAALAQLSARDGEAFDRAMIEMSREDLRSFTAIGHKDPTAATLSRLTERLTAISDHTVAA